MSGHHTNQHGRIVAGSGRSTPNGPPNQVTSIQWNHLQVPSYIPRQPQFAHMSNVERAMVRSPLAWHSPQTGCNNTDAASIFGYHHKPMDMNPLLQPPFPGTQSNPFGSVDLSIQSLSRKSLTPSPSNHQTLHGSIVRNSHTPTPPPSSMHPLPLPSSTSPALAHAANPIMPILISKLKSKEAPSIINPASMDPVVKGKKDNVKTSPPITDTQPYMNGDMSLYPNKTNSPVGSIFCRDTVQINNELMKMHGIDPTPLLPVPPLLAQSVTSHAIGFPSATYTDLSHGVMRSAPPSFQNSFVSGLNLLKSPSQTTGPQLLLKDINTLTISENNSSMASINNEDLIQKSSEWNGLVEVKSNSSSMDQAKRRRRKPNKTSKLSNDLSNTDDELSSIVTESQPSINSTSENSTSSDLKLNSEHTNQNETQNVNDKSYEIVDNMRLGLEDRAIVLSPPENNIRVFPTFQPPTPPPALELVNRINHVNSELEDNISQPVSIPNERIQFDSSLISTDNSKIETTVHDSTVDGVTHSELEILNTNISEVQPMDIEEPIEKTQSIETQSVSVVVESENKIDSCEVVEKSTDKDDSFEEVENKLEEMFAGIEDDRPINVLQTNDNLLDGDINNEIPVTNQIIEENSEPAISEPVKTIKKTPTKRRKKKPPKKTDNNKSGKSGNKKRGKGSKKQLAAKVTSSKTGSHSSVAGKANNLAGTSEAITQKFRGPYVHCMADGSETIINGPNLSAEDKIKKLYNSARSDIRGLYVSTLSMKYDADTTDVTWMCVFCKLGPHKLGLGDLFGPYIISTTCDDFAYSQMDPKDDPFKSNRTRIEMIKKRGIPITSNEEKATSPASLNANGHIKKKRKITNTTSTPVDNPSGSNPQLIDCKNEPVHKSVNIFYGMTKINTDTTSYEIWIHEDCAVWCSGVYMSGMRIIGLESAVWVSTRQLCTICQNYGAVVCCLQRGCDERAHIPCGRRTNWSLSEESFQSRCVKHCGSE